MSSELKLFIIMNVPVNPNIKFFADYSLILLSYDGF